MAKDLYHYEVRQALINDGWKITNDPYIIETDDVNFEVDLGAEKMLAAEKEHEKIAVEPGRRCDKEFYCILICL